MLNHLIDEDEGNLDELWLDAVFFQERAAASAKKLLSVSSQFNEEVTAIRDLINIVDALLDDRDGVDYQRPNHFQKY
jgi:hypothetical protein